MLKDVSTFCRKAGCRKVLMLGPQTKNLTVADIHIFGTEAAKLWVQIAVVEYHVASNRDVRFLENVMWNRGGSIRFLDAEEEAKDWLGV